MISAENNDKMEIRSGISGELKMDCKITNKTFVTLFDKLYSDKFGSVIREISCNAYDSHIMANKKDVPIHIYIPNNWEPNLIIQDFGTGLEPTRLVELFGCAFNSTKDQSNDQIGSFGLGAKSPFAITSSFTIENNFNGIKSHFISFKDEDGIPSKPLLTSQILTEEENGIKITIPVNINDISKIHQAIKHQLAYFNPKPIIANSDSFKWYETEVIFEVNSGKIYNTSFTSIYSRKFYALLGNILYKIDNHYLNFNIRSFEGSITGYNYIVIPFDIGELDITPSREDLSYVKSTIDNLNTKLSNFIEEYKASINEIISKSDNIFDAYKIWNEFFNKNLPHIRTIEIPKKYLQNIDILSIDKCTFYEIFNHIIYLGIDICKNAEFLESYTNPAGITYTISIYQCNRLQKNKKSLIFSDLQKIYFSDLLNLYDKELKIILVDDKKYLSKKLELMEEKYILIRINPNIKNRNFDKLIEFLKEKMPIIDWDDRVMYSSKITLPITSLVDKKLVKISNGGIFTLKRLYSDWDNFYNRRFVPSLEDISNDSIIIECERFNFDNKNYDNKVQLIDIVTIFSNYDIPYYCFNKSEMKYVKLLKKEKNCILFNDWYNQNIRNFNYSVDLLDFIKEYIWYHQFKVSGKLKNYRRYSNFIDHEYLKCLLKYENSEVYGTFSQSYDKKYNKSLTIEEFAFISINYPYDLKLQIQKYYENIKYDFYNRYPLFLIREIEENIDKKCVQYLINLFIENMILKEEKNYEI